MPLDMDDVVAMTESVCDKATEMFYSSDTFIYKFNSVKRELKKLSSLSRIRCGARSGTSASCCRSEASTMPSFKMKMRWRPNRRTNASI